MIVVDSSVWIDFLNGRGVRHVRRLQGVLGAEEIIVGDLMFCEVLQGLATERAAREVEALLNRFTVVAMGGTALAISAARNFRFFTAARFHHPKDDRFAYWHMVHREPHCASSQR